MRVTMFVEQLMQPIPGGIGTYVRAMLRHLPPQEVEVEPVVAFHRERDLFEAGLPHARRLRSGRRVLYGRWERGRGGGVGGTGRVVHAPSLAIPRRDRRPLVVTVHDVLFREFPEAFPPRGVRFHEAMLGRLHDADVVIAPSRATAVALAGLDEPHPDVRVIPMGTAYTAPPPEVVEEVLARLEVQRPYVLWSGTVEPRKNPEGVVRGFVAALDSGVPAADDLNLYLVGPPGWWSGDIAEMLSDRKLAERVRRLGDQPPLVRQALLAGAEAFVFPSLAEGFGLPVVEAMACGCPVVTSNRSSLPEVAGSAALLCDPDDPNSIGEALATLLRDPDLAADLRRLGLRRAANFTWERTARLTAAVYRDLAGRR
ncbi:MAG TPA: glycosyltransferase family 1 protein [Actinomycetota bacterium]|nr:glycosyltransferase family 1 protein [Actinomycetota bacterium]